MAKFGRWAGILILLSAIGLALLEAWRWINVAGEAQAPLGMLALTFWRAFISVGSLGVVVILLAELVRLATESRNDPGETGD